MLIKFVKNHTPYIAGELAEFEDGYAKVLIDGKRVAVAYHTKPMAPAPQKPAKRPEKPRKPAPPSRPRPRKDRDADKEPPMPPDAEQPANTDAPPDETPALENNGLRAVHKGRGKWAVVSEDGETLASGLTKERALDLINDPAPMPAPADD